MIKGFFSPQETWSYLLKFLQCLLTLHPCLYLLLWRNSLIYTGLKKEHIRWLLSRKMPLLTCCPPTSHAQGRFAHASAGPHSTGNTHLGLLYGEKKKKKKTQKVFNLSPKRRGDLLQMHGSFSSTKMDSALEPLMVGESTHRALAWT